MTSEEYTRRKREELRYLRRLAGLRGALPRVRDMRRVGQLKRRALFALRLRAVAEWSRCGHTSRNGRATATIGALRFTHSYQRYNLKVVSPGIFEAIYRECDRETRSFGAFTCSGMAAVHTALEALRRFCAPAPPRFVLSPTDYFETAWLAEGQAEGRFPPGKRPGAKFRILDSSSATPPAIADDARAGDVFIVDTTCWSTMSGTLAAVMNELLARHCLAVVVRSHLKLDGLGDEYAPLGSVLCVAPRSAPRIVRERYDCLKRVLADVVSRTGCLASLEDIPCYLADPAFKRLAHRRVEAVRGANAAFGEAMARSGRWAAAMLRFPHGLFSGFRTTHYRRLEALFVAAARAAGIPVCRAGSFGFDFLVLNRFQWPLDGSTCLRVCLPDAPTEKIAKFVRYLERRKCPAGLARDRQNHPDSA